LGPTALADTRLQQIELEVMELLLTDLDSALLHRRARFRSALLDCYCDEIVLRWKDYLEFLNGVEKVLCFEEIEEYDYAQTNERLFAWENAEKEGHQVAHTALREVFEKLLVEYDALLEDKTNVVGPVENDSHDDPIERSEIKERKKAFKKLLIDFEKALKRRMMSHLRLQCAIQIGERWDDYCKYVEKLKDFLDVSKVEELGEKDTRAAMDGWAKEKTSHQMQENGVHNLLEEILESFESQSTEWSVLPPLEMDVVKKETIGEKRKEAKDAIAAYEDALMRRGKYHDREKCVSDIKAQWKKITEFNQMLITKLDVTPIAEYDCEKTSEHVAKWGSMKVEYVNQNKSNHSKMSQLLDHFYHNEVSWSVLPPLSEQIVERSKVSAANDDANKTINYYEEILMKRQKFHERERCVADISSRWVEYVAFHLSTQTELKCEKLEVADAVTIDGVLSGWDEAKRQIIGKEYVLNTSLISLRNHFDAMEKEWECLPALGVEVVEKGDVSEISSKVKNLVDEYEKTLMKRKRFHEREKCIAEIAKRWNEYQEFAANIIKEVTLEQIAEMSDDEVLQRAELWSSFWDGRQIQEAHLRKGILTALTSYNVASVDWNELESIVVSPTSDDVSALQGEVMEAVNKFRNALMLKKKYVERKRLVAAIENHRNNYEVCVKEMKDTFRPESLDELGEEEINEIVKDWSVTKVKAQSKEFGLQKLLAETVAEYEKRGDEWSELDAIDTVIIRQDEIAALHVDTLDTVKIYENALMRRKKFYERKRCVAEIAKQCEEYLSFVQNIKETLNADEVHRMDLDELDRTIGEWSVGQKQKVIGTEETNHNALISALNTYEKKLDEFKELEPLQFEVANRDVAKIMRDEALKIIRDYEDALQLRRKFYDRRICLEDIAGRWRAYNIFVGELNEVRKRRVH
jgi:hypothetical protein